MTHPRNFSDQDLRNRSFRNQDLQGADFSRSDLRGCNFREANLHGASFEEARMGHSRKQLLLRSLSAIALAFVAAGSMADTVPSEVLNAFAVAFAVTFAGDAKFEGAAADAFAFASPFA
ncbi:MAG: pentapeptide repeat-containing protein, partial [Cyanobacteria bacterium P01_H01_bin.130]